MNSLKKLVAALLLTMVFAAVPQAHAKEVTIDLPPGCEIVLTCEEPEPEPEPEPDCQCSEESEKLSTGATRQAINATQMLRTK